MDKKGFTLVELLAVILLIALIASFALPQLVTQFSNNSAKLSGKQEQMIIDAAKIYVDSHRASYMGTSCLSLEKLVKANMLDETFIKNLLGDNYNSKKSISVSYSITTKTHTITLNNCSCSSC